MNYYCDNDRGAAEWVRQLILAGEIPEGAVDERSIKDIRAGDLAGFEQCHFFAGINGWPLALRLAGWTAGREVWTGSCPCQPFSSAGRRKGKDDERHLWPDFFRLIRDAKPSVVLGEQVASADGYEWLAGVRVDLEDAGYVVGAADLPAGSVGSPQKRQRLFWVASREGSGRRSRWNRRTGKRRKDEPSRLCVTVAQGDSNSRRLDKFTESNSSQVSADRIPPGTDASRPNVVLPLASRDLAIVRPVASAGQQSDGECGSGTGSLGGTTGDGPQGQREARPTPRAIERTDTGNFWDRFDIIHCTDGKSRRVESGVHPLAYGLPSSLVPVWLESNVSDPPATTFPGRVGLIRGYGNAIVPQVAAVFIRAFLEAERELSEQ